MDFRYERDGVHYMVSLEVQADGSYQAKIGDKMYRVELQRTQPGLLTLRIDGRSIRAYTARQKNSGGIVQHFVGLLEPEARHFDFESSQATVTRRRSTAAGSGSLKAQMPGQVVQILVAEGDAVEKGQTLLTLEAMKMEIRVAAPVDGIVSRLMVKVGDTVERGQQLAEVSPQEN